MRFNSGFKGLMLNQKVHRLSGYAVVQLVDA